MTFLRRTIGALLIALVFVAPLAIGTVHPWTRLVVFVAAAALLALILVERLRTGKRFPVTVPLLALLVALGATAIQLVPLPAGLLAWISPAAHDIFSTTLGEYGFHPLSLDPTGTWNELAKLGAYVAVFAAATTYASRSQRRRQLVLAVTGAATLVAGIALVQAALGSEKLLFFYRPQTALEGGLLTRGTFVNPNHFGALMCLGAPCALALGLREPRLRWAAFPAVILINLALVLSLSRSTLIAAPLAQILTYALDRWQLRSDGLRASERSGGKAALVLAAIGAIAVATSIGLTGIESELDRTTERELAEPTDARSKFHLWSEASALIWRYPWSGVGRGAFEQAFTQVNDQGGQHRYSFVENGYLQSVIDWGAPVAALLLVMSGWAFLMAFRQLATEPLAVGALGAIFGLAVHEGADFAVELPGVAIPALVVLATLFARRSSESVPGRLRIPMRRGYVALPVVLALVTAVAFAMPPAHVEAARMAELARNERVPTDEVLARAEDVVGRHPADYFVHAIVAERLAREPSPQAMKWLNLAIYLNPSHPGPHLVAAELLASAGQRIRASDPMRADAYFSQAVLEFRAAAEGATDLRPVWERLGRYTHGVDELLRATPDDPRSMTLLADWLYARQSFAHAERVYALAAERSPGEPQVLQQLVRLAVQRRDPEAARTRLTALVAVDGSATTRRLAVTERMLAGDLEGAARTLDGITDRSANTFVLELELARELARLGDHAGARDRLDRLGWQQDRQYVILLHEARADVERRAGNEHQAGWETDQATRLRESQPAAR